MSINKYRLYIESIFELAKTLTIKSEYSAIKVNEAAALAFPSLSVDPIDKTTWKYYRNICGEYHATDEPMSIKSLDTMQTITFSKDNLAIHSSTALAYRYGSRYYRELVARFPEQEELIIGILYPAKMQEAINAPDFTVLAYPSYLVEDNEEDLVRNINSWLQDYTPLLYQGL